jgi:hypothetical protein
MNAIQKLLFGSKNVPQKASRSISRISVADLPSFIQNLMQTHCMILPSITDRMKHEVEKALVCSQSNVTWQIDAIGSWNCELGLPSHLLSPRQLQQ